MMVDRRHCHDGAFVFECDIDEKAVRLARAAIQFVLTQRLERGTQLGAVKLRLFPGREVAALIDFMEVNEFVKSATSPRLWCLIELSRKDRDGHRERNLAGFLRTCERGLRRWFSQ